MTNQASTITYIELDDIDVMSVAGDPDTPISKQAPLAFQLLEAPMKSLRGRKFYGVILGNTYRACVALVPEEIDTELPHPGWTIPGGKYARCRIKNWDGDTTIIGPIFERSFNDVDRDTSRPTIEFYRSQRDLILMLPAN